MAPAVSVRRRPHQSLTSDAALPSSDAGAHPTSPIDVWQADSGEDESPPQHVGQPSRQATSGNDVRAATPATARVPAKRGKPDPDSDWETDDNSSERPPRRPRNGRRPKPTRPSKRRAAPLAILSSSKDTAQALQAALARHSAAAAKQKPLGKPVMVPVSRKALQEGTHNLFFLFILEKLELAGAFRNNLPGGAPNRCADAMVSTITHAAGCAGHEPSECVDWCIVRRTLNGVEMLSAVEVLEHLIAHHDRQRSPQNTFTKLPTGGWMAQRAVRGPYVIEYALVFVT